MNLQLHLQCPRRRDDLLAKKIFSRRISKTTSSKRIRLLLVKSISPSISIHKPKIILIEKGINARKSNLKKPLN